MSQENSIHPAIEENVIGDFHYTSRYSGEMFTVTRNDNEPGSLETIEGAATKSNSNTSEVITQEHKTDIKPVAHTLDYDQIITEFKYMTSELNYRGLKGDGTNTITHGLDLNCQNHDDHDTCICKSMRWTIQQKTKPYDTILKDLENTIMFGRRLGLSGFNVPNVVSIGEMHYKAYKNDKFRRDAENIIKMAEIVCAANQKIHKLKSKVKRLQHTLKKATKASSETPKDVKQCSWFKEKQDCPICLDSHTGESLLFSNCSHVICLKCFVSAPADCQVRCPTCRSIITHYIRYRAIGDRLISRTIQISYKLADISSGYFNSEEIDNIQNNNMTLDYTVKDLRNKMTMSQELSNSLMDFLQFNNKTAEDETDIDIHDLDSDSEAELFENDDELFEYQ